MTFKRFCFFLAQLFFFQSPQTIVPGVGGEAIPPQLVRDCVWRVRKQCTKVRECKNSGIQGTGEGGGLSVEVSSGFFFPAPAQAPGREFKPVKRLLRAMPVYIDLCCSEVVWAFKFRECPLCSHCLPHPRLIPDNPAPVLQKRRPRFSVDEGPEYAAKWTELGSDL